MYSRNDYRYYLEHQLMVSGDYLAHYGTKGMKWGIRKDKYTSKISSNNKKIAQYQQKLNTVGAKKRAEKAAKYQAKQDKLDRKAAKARARLAQGKSVSSGQMKKIAKAEKYRALVAKNSAKNDKYQAKIAKLESKNTKLSKKVGKLDYKITRENQLSKIKTDVPMKQLMSNYNKSYKNSTKMMKKLGSTADRYEVTNVDNQGRVTSMKPIWDQDIVLNKVNRK